MRAALRKLHSYEVPECIEDGNEPYLNWIVGTDVIWEAGRSPAHDIHSDSGKLDRGQRLIQIGENVLNVLDANRNAH